ncbi:MAG: type II toxin-antitoxin system HicB family antitoxin [Thermodesulfobacteriota bacterium]|nr:type II toxin-antitoxin system HicB family antitoxin [Thermodesulfobacteriota bacterium]
MKYKTVLRKTDEGYSFSCPGLPGCWSQGGTEKEAVDNIKDAILDIVAAISESVQGEDVREVEIAV